MGTGMLQVLEDVMKEGGKWVKVAVAFVDISSGFDSVPPVSYSRSSRPLALRRAVSKTNKRLSEL